MLEQVSTCHIYCSLKDDIVYVTSFERVIFVMVFWLTSLALQVFDKFVK